MLLEDQLFCEERESVEQHVDSCPGCRAVYADTVAFRAAQPSTPPSGVGGRPASDRVRLAAAPAAAALALAIGVLALVPVLRGDYPRSSARRELFAGVGDTRPLLPRLTGGYRYAPPPLLPRAPSEGPFDDSARWPALSHAQDIRSAAEARPTAAHLGDLGAAHLFLGNFDVAARTLERAAALAPADPDLRSDLGAAYLARSSLPDHEDDLPSALEAIDAALARRADFAEARFNRALALQQIGLPRVAAAAWLEYLRRHPGDAWASEARDRLDGLNAAPPPRKWEDERERLLAAAPVELPTVARIVERFREPVRMMVQEEILPAWGEAELANDRGTALRHLASARALADALTAATGDGFVGDTVTEVAGAKGERRRLLAAAHRAFGAGAKALNGSDIDAAAEKLLAASAAFRRVQSPAELWAQLLAIKARFYSGAPPAELLPELEALAPGIEGSRSTVLRARVSWYIGLLRVLEGEVERGLPEYQQASELLEAAGETDSLLWIRYLKGEAYSLVGDSKAAWRERFAILALLPTVSDRDRAAQLLLGASSAALSFEYRRALAAAVLDEVVAGDFHKASTTATVETLIRRARLHAESGDDRATGADLAEVARLVDRIPRGFRARLQPRREAIAGLSTATANPRRAIRHYSRAIAEYEQNGEDGAIPDLLARRAELWIALNDPGRAQADLQRAMALLEDAPAALDARTRIDATHEPFALATRLLAERGDDEGAFLTAERGRARALLAVVTQGRKGRVAASRPLGLREVQSQLPPGVRLLTYTSLQDRILMWGVSRTESRFHTTPLAAVVADAAALSADLGAGAWTSQSRKCAARLFERVALPLLGGGEREGTLVVVPDGPLHQVPFAALVDDGGQFLVERHAVTVAPSATLYLHAKDRAAVKADDGSAPTALVFGDPEHDPRIHPTLHRLPGAAEEAARVAALYASSDLRLGIYASRDAFLREAPASSVIHVAGHALLSRSMPSHSSLALAPSGRAHEGTLFAFEIARLDLARTRVVFLGNCESGTGEVAAGEGSLSLARAFLSADVPSVVAGLWRVDDRRTRELLVRAHQALARGAAPAAALRTAQLALLRSRDPSLRSPASWAAFQILGT